MRFLMCGLLFAALFALHAEDSVSKTSEWPVMAITLKTGKVIKAHIMEQSGKLFIDEGSGPKEFYTASSINSLPDDEKDRLRVLGADIYKMVVKVDELPEAEQDEIRVEIETRRANLPTTGTPLKPALKKPYDESTFNEKSQPVKTPDELSIVGWLLFTLLVFVVYKYIFTAGNNKTKTLSTFLMGTTVDEFFRKAGKGKPPRSDFFVLAAVSLALALFFFVGIYAVIILSFLFGVIIVLIHVCKFLEFKFSYPTRQRMRLKDIIASHVKALALKRRQTKSVDAYGHEDDRKWLKERKYFVETVIGRQTVASQDELFGWIEWAIDEFEIQRARSVSPLSKSLPANMTPTEFEHYCAQLLSQLGWTSRVTKASGDQGVDVIAERPGRKVVIQCKLWGAPVGNSAVQEVLAAKQFEEADAAAVVTNNSYTPSARALASKCGVSLLHYTELDKIR